MTNARNIALGLCACALTLLAGCVSDTRVGEDGAHAMLTAEAGHTVPASGELVVVWTVSAGSPDYSYAFGRRSFADTTTVALPLGTPPPAEALNYGLGVAIILAVSPEASIPDGRLDDATESTLEAGAFLGAASNQAIIYRNPASATDITWWASDFETGYSCGEGVPNPAGSGFDGFRPIECSDVIIRFDDPAAFDFPNWT
jgi:hypothetical protein